MMLEFLFSFLIARTSLILPCAFVGESHGIYRIASYALLSMQYSSVKEVR